MVFGIVGPLSCGGQRPVDDRTAAARRTHRRSANAPDGSRNRGAPPAVCSPMQPVILGAALATTLLATAPTTVAREAAPAQPAACHSAVQRGVLPVWARTGFSEPRPRMPHVVGRAGRIAALEFGDPLRSPPSEHRSNKILWVSRRPWTGYRNLAIHAQRMQGTHPIGQPVSRLVRGGPGPSIVDLPAAGCWRLVLRWAGRSDSLDLRYAPG